MGDLCTRCRQETEATKHVILDHTFWRVVLLCNVCYDSWKDLLKRQAKEREEFVG